MKASTCSRIVSRKVVAFAYNPQHAQVAMQAWSMLDAAIRGSTSFIVAASDGDNMFIYTDSTN